MYNVLDGTYFAKKGNNPRAAINQLICDENVSALDMCCGTLSNTIPIAKSNKTAKFIGIDISKQMLQVAHNKIVKNHLNNVLIKEMDATDTPFQSDRFDYVIIGLVLHEMSPLLRKRILKEAYRVLKTNGSLIVLEWEKPASFFQRFLYFPLLVSEQLMCKTFLEFYNCDKGQFFRKNHFEIYKQIHCNYSAVYELKKV